jgi:formylglycine-generating enzyme required for sulfatase activity
MKFLEEKLKFLEKPYAKKLAIWYVWYLVLNEIFGWAVFVGALFMTWKHGTGWLGSWSSDIKWELKDADRVLRKKADSQYTMTQDRIYRLEKEMQSLKWKANETQVNPNAVGGNSPLTEPSTEESIVGAGAGEERDFAIAPGVVIRMCWIPAGHFNMGSPDHEQGRRDDMEGPCHRVEIKEGFWLAKTELTQQQWLAGAGIDTSARSDESRSGVADIWMNEDRLPPVEMNAKFRGKNFPVQRIEWVEAKAWCTELTKRYQAHGALPRGWEFTLPTEAQWEYACRAGTASSLNNGKDLNQSHYEKECKHLDEIAWYHNNSGDQAHPVGLKKPNAWGLHDMHGNVQEWCDDLYRPYPYGQNIPEPNPEYAEFRSFRGGAWTCWAKGCRSASRRRYAPDYFDHDLGLRPALRLVAKP